MRDMKKCPKCGGEAPDEVLFCRICGAELVEVPLPPAVLQTCPSCGAKIKPEMVYCPKCGKRIRVKKTCPSCGFENPLHAKFCKKCGSQLEIDAKPLEKPVLTPVAPPAPPAVSVRWPTKVIASLAISVICMVIGWFAFGLILYPVAIVCGLYVATTQKQNAAARIIGAALAIISIVLIGLYLLWFVSTMAI